MTIPNDVTLVEGAIHDPGEPRHVRRAVGPERLNLIAFDPAEARVTQTTEAKL